MNDLMASGYGRIVANSVRITNGVAKFTLQSSKNRYFVTVAGYEQCAVVQSAERSGSQNIFVVGKLFSFTHPTCAQHHCGIDALFILPVPSDHNSTDASMFSLIEQQLVNNQMRNGNGKITILA